MKLRRYWGVLVLGLALMTGCVDSTAAGECIGVSDDEVPTLRYKVNAQNVVVAIIFSETVVIPLVVLFTNVKCPVGPR